MATDPKLAARLAGMSSDQKLDAILEMLVRIDRRLSAAPKDAPSEAPPAVADDAELDGQYGDERIKKDPKRWTGESYAGRRMSETTPEYLDAVAGFAAWAHRASMEKARELEAHGQGDEAHRERTNAKYREYTARRARGWAKRLRAGWRPATEQVAAVEPAREDDDTWD